jgi:ATP synthase protein I
MLAEWSSIIFLLPASLAVGFLLGYWLDRLVGSSPWLKICGLVLGGAAGFYQTFRIVSGRGE